MVVRDFGSWQPFLLVDGVSDHIFWQLFRYIVD